MKSKGPTGTPAIYLGVSKYSGTSKWMVFNGKPIKMDDLGVPLFMETAISGKSRLVKYHSMKGPD